MEGQMTCNWKDSKHDRNVNSEQYDAHTNLVIHDISIKMAVNMLKDIIGVRTKYALKTDHFHRLLIRATSSQSLWNLRQSLTICFPKFRADIYF